MYCAIYLGIYILCGDSETYITIEMIEMTALKIWSPLFLPASAWLDLN